MKAAVFDIECSDLCAIGPGRFLCAVIKPLDSDKIWLFRHDLMGEGKAIAATVEVLGGFDLLIGHNIQKFDMPMMFSFFVSRGLHGEFCNPFVYDTMLAFSRIGYRTRLNGFGKPTKSLAFAVDFFGIPQEKTSIFPREHWLTLWGKGKCRKEAMDNLVAHCMADVTMNEKLYWRILPDDKRAIIKRWR